MAGARRCVIAKIVVFAFDLTEASQIRRISSLIQLGHDVCTLSFRRGNMNTGFAPGWPNVDLGSIANQRFGRRMVRLLRAVPIVLRHRAMLKGADVVIARNLDLLALAWLARAAAPGRRARLVYECLDIHGLMTGTSTASRILRGVERWLLARTDLLWVSSPGFLRSYFGPLQGYAGPSAVIENKLWFDGPPPPRPTASDRSASAGPIVLGWVGSIRCAASLRVLAGAAERLGPDTTIAVHGNIHRHAVPDFDAVVAAHDSITYHGPYRYPDDLAEIYLRCDAVWAQDLWQRGGNSDWLLPNRIYEAGWFGCPSIAVADTETGRRIAASGLGFVIDTPTAEALSDLLSGLDRATLKAASARLLAMPDAAFRLDGSDVATALQPALDPGWKQAASTAPGPGE